MFQSFLEKFPSLVLALKLSVPHPIAFLSMLMVFVVGLFFISRHRRIGRQKQKNSADTSRMPIDVEVGQESYGREAGTVEGEKGVSSLRWFTFGTALSACVMLTIAVALYRFSPGIFQWNVDSDSNLLISGGGRVLAAEDDRPDGEVVPSQPMFASENFKIGHIAVGGESEIFFPHPETEQIEISALSYRLVNSKDSGDTGVVVQWATNKPTRGQVYYRKHSETDDRVVSEEKYNIEHELFLDDIEVENTYVLRAGAIDRWGNEKEGETYALYSGADTASLFDLLSEAFGDLFGWARR